MDLDVQTVINDLLEQNKQLTLQLAIARTTVSQLQAQLAAEPDKEA